MPLVKLIPAPAAPAAGAVSGLAKRVIGCFCMIAALTVTAHNSLHVAMLLRRAALPVYVYHDS
jgi:hypothetical protein